MSSEKPAPDKSNTPARTGTIGYEQASQPAKGRQATVGFGNAMWSFQKPSQPAMAAVQPPTLPPAPAGDGGIATAQTLAVDGKDTFDFMAQASPNAPTMLAESNAVDAVSAAEAPTLGSDSLGVSSNGLSSGASRGG
jgi:hypothetical protein